MSGEERLQLWIDTLGANPERDAAAVDRLRASYRSVRARAAVLAQTIAADLPDFTVHDQRHLDAVWDLADKLRGNVRLNPLEGYVFGISVLLHDLGMGVAAYPGGISAIRADPRWEDAMALRNARGLPVGTPERTAAERAATALVLRARHSEHATELASAYWEGPDGREYLIDDNELRTSLGTTIGEIAASHGRSVETLVRNYSARQGAPAFMPSDWSIDALMIGSLLRTADAANVDATRAPAFDHAVQQPTGTSRDHWTFQRFLARPYVHDGSLTYTSTRPFGPGDSEAWWLAYDMLRMVDRELAMVDRTLRDNGRTPLAAAGVSGAGAAVQLSKFLRVDGWMPVDASVFVGDVAALVESLGGENLYGSRPWVALRELLQNASDAVLAHEAIGGLSSDEGRIIVDLAFDRDRETLTVEDNGVGMTEQVLVGSLLNFGQSFWGTDLMLTEFPGLAATGFRSAGRYGIGFFSVFMLGDRVRVTTRARSAAPRETTVLEFGDGVRGRPMVRAARDSEQLQRPGTRVNVWIRPDITATGGLLRDDLHGIRPLPELCGTLFPAADVDLVVRDHGETRSVCKAGDWRHMSGPELLTRIAGTSFIELLEGVERQLRAERAEGVDAEPAEDDIVLARNAISRHLRPLHGANGDLVGRAAVAPDVFLLDEAGTGSVCVGGLRAHSLIGGVVGILLGESERAARDSATLLATEEELARWATEQAELISRAPGGPRTKHGCAAIVRGFGGEVKDLPVCFGAAGWMTEADVARTELPDELVLVFESSLHDEFNERGPVTLHDHVFATQLFIPEAVTSLRRGPLDDFDPLFGRPIGPMERGSLGGRVAEVACEAWKVPFDALVDAEQPEPDDALEVGIADGRPLRVIEAVVLRRPSEA